MADQAHIHDPRDPRDPRDPPDPRDHDHDPPVGAGRDLDRLHAQSIVYGQQTARMRVRSRTA
jgi:hypothetical protein